VPVLSSDGSVAVPEQPEPRLALTVRWVAADEVHTAWTWRYRVGTDDRVYALSETRGLRAVRRPEREQELLDALVLDDEQAYHLCRGHQRGMGLEDERTFRDAHAILFAEQLLPGLRGQVEVDEVGEQPDYRELSGTPVVHVTTRPDQDEARTDWLDLEVEVVVDGTHIALAHVLEALTKGMDRVILRSGKHLRIDRPELARLAQLVEAAGELQEQPEDGVRLGHHDLGLWDELAEVGIVDAQAARWVRSAQALRSLDTLPEVEPVGLRAELRAYQLAGFRWLAYLWESGLGGILADDMGLGKTLQTLALVAHARDRGAAPFLVVAPTSVVGMWAHEAATFTPGLDVRVVGESQARRGESVRSLAEGADVVVTSYTLFRIEASEYVDLDWGGLVLDEAQTVKNHHGKTHQAVRRLEVPFRLALTGTPMENRLMELWSLLSIVAPGLYPWPQRFQELVAIPVERLGDREVLARFRRRIRPFLLRRTKERVAADLPAKQEQVLEVSLTPRHRTVYDTHLQRERQTVLGLVDEFDKHRIAIFRSLTRLRQLSLDAGLVDEAYDGIGSAKVDVLVDHLLELAEEGHRALVFSQFTSFLTRVRQRLEREGLTSSYLDGTTRHRQAVVDGFRSGDDPVFLISLKAGGVGLTLTEADYVFVLDPWWNPAVEAQAVDRTHRIGQTRPVNVYRLVSTNTIEEKVIALKARKAALFAQVVDDDALMSAPLGADDVRALFED
ncbi:MAG TPA: DEAD/DEAH box helicase, partial [Nocardioidaceae bacterium]|nr:DEAD/DEAH box helicase [Nocardioidaceae bacterium]